MYGTKKKSPMGTGQQAAEKAKEVQGPNSLGQPREQALMQHSEKMHSGMVGKEAAGSKPRSAKKYTAAKKSVRG
jgi:hypothetical protein